MKVMIWGGLVLLFLSIFLLIFTLTGGIGMWRVVMGYLIKDIPEKKYSWSDFIPNQESRKVSGFYSDKFSNDSRLVIWTLAGLRSFRHNPGKSVYYHRDTCGVVKQLVDKGFSEEVEGGQTTLTNPLAVYVNPIAWDKVMKQEYLVTVQWVESGEGIEVENVWSVSGRYREIGRVEEGVCD